MSLPVYINEIDEFAGTLSEDTPDQEVSAFLVRLAKTLKNTNRHNISPDLIPATERLILKLQQIVFSSNRKYHRNVVNTLTVILGQAQDLGIEMDITETLRGGFYSQVVALGIKLDELAGYLGVTVPLIIMATKHAIFQN